MDRQKVQSYLKNKNMHLITEADDSTISEIVRTNLEKYHLDIPVQPISIRNLII